MAVATLLTVTPAAFAATPAAPQAHPAPENQTSGLGSALVNSPAQAPVAIAPTEGANSLLALMTMPPMLIGGTSELLSPPVSYTSADRVIAYAKAHLGAPWVWGAEGPYAFDCTGLVLAAYNYAGVVNRIGGWANRSGYAMLSWARYHGIFSTGSPRLGDVVIWGGGSHAGIYLGSGMAISTLTSGITIHGVFAVTAPFTGYIHTGIGGYVSTTTSTTTLRAIGTRYANSYAKLRYGHSTGSTLLATLSYGTRLTLYRSWPDAYGRTWYQVSANGRLGWVLASQTHR